jgi:hypothetical protein
MTATTFKTALDKIGVSVPAHLVADAEVPVLTGPQTQGDLIIVPIKEHPADMKALPIDGHQVVVGESTGNTHWLHAGFDSPDVQFARVDAGLTLVVVSVPVGQTAELIHTDEHGANAMGPGLYAINGKRELADEIRRVTD